MDTHFKEKFINNQNQYGCCVCQNHFDNRLMQNRIHHDEIINNEECSICLKYKRYKYNQFHKIYG